MKETTTIEELALMINRGFENQMKYLDQRFEKMDQRFENLDARVGRIEADIHELRGEIVYRHEFEDALSRIKYLEKKLGIESDV